MADKIAEEGNLWVCLACGKTSESKYGISGKHSYGWDVSCMMNAEEVSKDKLVFNNSNRVIEILKEKKE